jgi:hypothetical protein
MVPSRTTRRQNRLMWKPRRAELAEACLALLNGTSAGSKKNCKKKALAKAKEALAKA